MKLQSIDIFHERIDQPYLTIRFGERGNYSCIFMKASQKREEWLLNRIDEREKKNAE